MLYAVDRKLREESHRIAFSIDYDKGSTIHMKMATLRKSDTFPTHAPQGKSTFDGCRMYLGHDLQHRYRYTSEANALHWIERYRYSGVSWSLHSAAECILDVAPSEIMILLARHSPCLLSSAPVFLLFRR